MVTHFLVGVLPGAGATISSYVAYALERRRARELDRFGHGAIEGVAAPEAANNAATSSGFIPLPTLGLPANVVMALMLGFGVFGYLAEKFGYSLAPLVLAFVLGPLMETSRGNPSSSRRASLRSSSRARSARR